MKVAGKIAITAGILGFLMLNAGCKPDPTTPEDPKDKQIELLTKSVWKATAVSLDNSPLTPDYANFTLTMTGTKGQDHVSFTTAGRPALSAWPVSGTLTFDSTSPLTLLSRDDTPPVPVTYAVTADNLTMTFDFSGNGYTARVGNVTGQWSFTFTH